MELSILAFGKIADITDRSSWKVAGVSSTADLRRVLEEQFPALQGMSYQIAIDKRIATGDTPLAEGAEVALLPPFSGG